MAVVSRDTGWRYIMGQMVDTDNWWERIMSQEEVCDTIWLIIYHNG